MNYDLAFPPLSSPSDNCVYNTKSQGKSSTEKSKRQENERATEVAKQTLKESQAKLSKPKTIKDIAKPEYKQLYAEMIKNEESYLKVSKYFEALICVMAGYHAGISYKDSVIDIKNKEILKTERLMGVENYSNLSDLKNCISSAIQIKLAALYEKIKGFNLEKRQMIERWESQKNLAENYGQGIKWRQKEIQDLLDHRKYYLSITTPANSSVQSTDSPFTSPAMQQVIEILELLAILKEEIYTFKDIVKTENKKEVEQNYYQFKKRELNLIEKFPNIEKIKKERIDVLDKEIKLIELNNKKEKLALAQAEKKALEIYWTQAKHRLENEIKPALETLKIQFQIVTNENTSEQPPISQSLQEITKLMQKVVGLKEIIKMDNSWEPSLKENEQRKQLYYHFSLRFANLSKEIESYQNTYKSHLKRLDEGVSYSQCFIEILKNGESTIAGHLQKVEQHLATRVNWKVEETQTVSTPLSSSPSNYLTNFWSFGSSKTNGDH